MPTTPFSSAPSKPGFASSAASRALLRKRARSGSTARLSAGSRPSAARPCDSAKYAYALALDLLACAAIIEKRS